METGYLTGFKYYAMVLSSSEEAAGWSIGAAYCLYSS